MRYAFLYIILIAYKKGRFENNRYITIKTLINGTAIAECGWQSYFNNDEESSLIFRRERIR